MKTECATARGRDADEIIRDHAKDLERQLTEAIENRRNAVTEVDKRAFDVSAIVLTDQYNAAVEFITKYGGAE